MTHLIFAGTYQEFKDEARRLGLVGQAVYPSEPRVVHGLAGSTVVIHTKFGFWTSPDVDCAYTELQQMLLTGAIKETL